MIIKTREDLDKETQWQIKFGLLQFVRDSTLYISDRYALAEFFEGLYGPWASYMYFVCFFIVSLTFFMMFVSFN